MITDYTKQENLLKPDKFGQRINIIGCGALGSWVAMIVLKMGFKNVNVYDFDTIEEHNIPNQLFAENDIGNLKITALLRWYDSFFNDEESRLRIFTNKLDASNSMFLKGVTFCCVDTMSGRKELFSSVLENGLSDLWIEGRIGLYGAYIYTIDKDNQIAYNKYKETLYDDTEAEVSACGVSQTALPAAINAASVMVMQMIQHLNNKDNLVRKIEYQIPDIVVMKDKWQES